MQIRDLIQKQDEAGQHFLHGLHGPTKFETTQTDQKLKSLQSFCRGINPGNAQSKNSSSTGSSHVSQDSHISAAQKNRAMPSLDSSRQQQAWQRTSPKVGGRASMPSIGMQICMMNRLRKRARQTNIHISYASLSSTQCNPCNPIPCTCVSPCVP